MGGAQMAPLFFCEFFKTPLLFLTSLILYLQDVIGNINV